MVRLPVGANLDSAVSRGDSALPRILRDGKTIVYLIRKFIIVFQITTLDYRRNLIYLFSVMWDVSDNDAPLKI